MVDGATLFTLGLISGVTVCSLTCLPIIGPYLLATGNGFKDGVLGALSFGIGKIACYATLAGLAAALGRELHPGAELKLVMGLVLILVALAIPFTARHRCRSKCRPATRLPLMAVGAATSIIPCPPLAAILVLASGQDSILQGIALGFYYGLGLTLSPLLIAGGGLALISQKLNREVRGLTPYLQGAAMLIMILLGVQMIYGGFGHGMAQVCN
ncbi:MAG: sulfite exporter TauE/SafE family protein [Proteobacteria bacterium]|nr:sulfite exporter TauE/SafE family protein [Pseudomonadota bacterium]MBU1687438.1 sulfite exporter TauE/SafE family protein [Pseudomonadota bacterium]